MDPRRGEKIGWIGGWCGGFAWLAILGAIQLIGGHMVAGVAACGLVALAAMTIIDRAPWRHPTTPAWRLMLPIYALFFAGLFLYLKLLNGYAESNLNPWSAFVLLPILSPFWTMGRRRWRDGEATQRT